MGLQSKTGTGIKTKVRQPYQREDRVALAEKGERIRQLWQGEERGPRGLGVLLFATQLKQQERLCWEEKGRKDSCWWAMRRCHMALD